MTAVLLVHVALLAGLLASGQVQLDPRADEPPIQAFDVVEPLPPLVRVEPLRPERAPRKEAEASPPNLKSEAAPVIAPEPAVPLALPTPVLTAETPGTGVQLTQGAAPLAGPGTGAGGLGNGTGAGGSGSGTGAGGGGGVATGPRQIAGSISRRDYPRELRKSDVPVEVIRLQYTIGVDGRVHDCRVTQSSGTPLLDQHTCTLYETRFRYLPARDAAGNPVEITVHGTRSWYILNR